MPKSKNSPALAIRIPKQRIKSSISPPLIQGPLMIIPGLYLGCRNCSLDTNTLEQLGIRVVVNVAKECSSPYSSPTLLRMKQSTTAFPPSPPDDSGFKRNSTLEYYDFHWTHNQDLRTGLDEALKIIEDCQSQNIPILVHCLQGISRSPTLIIAYIMKDRRIAFEEAYEFVKAKAPGISPNISLVSHLVACARDWGDVASQ